MPDWIIQTNMEGVNTDLMIAEVLNQGGGVHKIEYSTGLGIDFSKYDHNDCIICYGDIGFVRQVQRRALFIPGAWCNFRNMKCSIYYAYFGEYLLNRQYLMMPVGELLREWDNLALVSPIFNEDKFDFLKPIFAVNPCGPKFIRPDSGAEPFTGYVVAPDERHKIQSLVQAVGPETLIVVSPEKKITAEWRFVVCDRKVVAGCQYLPTESPAFTPLSFRLAEIIASKEWQPDLCYTVDIAESGGKMYLLEINSFSCAGFYDCDIASIVRHASETAFSEWKEYR